MKPPPSRKKGKAGTVQAEGLSKSPTGIRGLDAITEGGLPRGRPTLVCGGTGSGKTLLGLEFLVNGARDFDEPGVFVTFEERPEDLAINTASLHFDLPELIARKQLLIEQILVERSEIVETGEYNLDGLFIRLGAAIDAIGAQRVVLDTIEVLFAALANLGILRSELHRLFTWLKDRGVTAIVTGERGDGTLTRHGLEEYVSDCVIVLDNSLSDRITTRRLRIVKYRGSSHGTNEYPFVIDAHGFAVVPITEISLTYAASTTCVSSGIPKLDTMLGGRGYYQGSTVMVSGRAGTGKSSIAAHFIDAACRRGERSLYCAMEESPDQIIRNMRSIGIDLEPWSRKGILEFAASRPTTFGLDVHINRILERVETALPQIVVIDPISSMENAGSAVDIRGMLMRLIDILKARGITALFTSLTASDEGDETTGIGISSLVDSWLLVRDLEERGERTRALYVIKSRGMAHSKQVRELLLTDNGIDLEEICIGPDGIVTGSARATLQARDRAAERAVTQQIERRQRQLEHRNKALQAQIAALQAEHAADVEDLEAEIARDTVHRQALLEQRHTEAEVREQAAVPGPARRKRKSRAQP